MAIQLKEFGSGVGFFKAGLYGNAGSGKTFTATKFALGIKEFLKLPGQIAFQDTETGAEYVDKEVLKATGKHILGIKSRSLSDTGEFLNECVKVGVAVAIIDSTTHIWEEVQKSYLKQLNDKRREAGKSGTKTSIEWQDRGPLNELWDQKFTALYLNLPIHIIICGRSGNIWEQSVNEETGKKELNKIGTKMKTQNEAAYEPSFLAEMEREQRYVNGVQTIFRTMTVIKDRFQLLDGKTFENPTFDAIKPHVAQLTPGAKNEIDLSRETQTNPTVDGDTEWTNEKKQRVIFCEEIQALLLQHYPGQSADEKKAKGEIVKEVFGTGSWTAVEAMNSTKLKEGLSKMTKKLAEKKAEAVSK